MCAEQTACVLRPFDFGAANDVSLFLHVSSVDRDGIHVEQAVSVLCKRVCACARERERERERERVPVPQSAWGFVCVET